MFLFNFFHQRSGHNIISEEFSCICEIFVLTAGMAEFTFVPHCGGASARFPTAAGCLSETQVS